MSTPLVAVERLSSGVARIRLQNGKVNSLSSAVLTELHLAAQALTSEPPGAVVICGSDRIFAAGADISEFSGPDEARVIGRLFFDALNAVAAIPRVVIAAVAGPALGGGCELALACDLRLCSSSAKFGQPEILLGIIPGGGGTQRLPRVVGSSRAKELMITGRPVKAAEALAIGLADEVVAPEALHERALALAAEVARGAVQAQALVKRAVDQGVEGDLASGLLLERGLFELVFHTDDSRIGVQSFLENGPGKATFSGR